MGDFSPTGWYYWIRATYYDTEANPPRHQGAFSGYWLSEGEARNWANSRYSCLPGATFEVVKSKSRQRDVARNEKRHSMIEAGEGSVPDILRVRFRNQSKEE